MNNNNRTSGYAARLEIDYPEKLDRMTTFFRILWIIPIAIILGIISGAGETITNTVFLNTGNSWWFSLGNSRSRGPNDPLSTALSTLVVRLLA
jgi:hypothetical protein